ncbi:MAG: hypothetical protein ACWGHP_18120 [Stenotrophomonas sp.]
MAGAHFRALVEQAALHDAAHLGTDLRGAHGGHAAGQFVIDAVRPAGRRVDHADTRCCASGVSSGLEQAVVMARVRAAIRRRREILLVFIAVHNAAQAADRF